MQALFWMLCVYILALFSVSALGSDSEFLRSCGEQQKQPAVFVTGNQQTNGSVSDEVKVIFENHCASCHSGGSGFEPIPDIFDVSAMKAVPGLINPADPEGSDLYQAVATARMPFRRPKLEDSQIEAIRKWIEADAPDFDQKDIPQSGTPFLTYEDEVQCILRDASKNVSKAAAYYTRYLSLIPQWNSANTVALDELRQALFMALNDVSLKTKLGKVVFVDKLQTIARFDLRDFALDFDDWEISFLPRYRYAFVPFDNHATFAEELAIERITGSARAWARADVFVTEISQPPLYYKFLRFPKTVKELEEDYLHLKYIDQLIEGRVHRAGMRISGVANHNRIVDIAELEYNIGSAHLSGPGVFYTKSYDFEIDVKEKNIFFAPFGPADLFQKVYAWLSSSRIFKADASEGIFTLPNRRMGFYAADGNGVLADSVPTTIAYDPLNTAPYIGKTPGEILPGVSCSGCHSTGLNPFRDDIRKYVTKSAGFNNQEVKAVKELYPEQSTLEADIKAFNVVYGDSVKQLNLPQTVTTRRGQPVWTTVRSYEAKLTAQQLAAELYLTEDQLKNAVFHDPNLAKTIGLDSFGGGTVSRDNVEKFLPDILKNFYVGKQLVFKNGSTSVDTQQYCDVFVYNRSNNIVRFWVDYEKDEQVTLHAGQHKQWKLKKDMPASRMWDVWFRTTGNWYSYHDTWTLNPCVNHQFLSKSGRTKLWISK